MLAEAPDIFAKGFFFQGLYRTFKNRSPVVPDNLPCFLLNVRKWLCSDTVRALHRMGGRGVNAYLFLLCEAWLQTPTGTLPNDEEVLIELARVTPTEWNLFWPIIKPKFASDGNGRIFSQQLVNEATVLASKQRAGVTGWTAERREAQSRRMKQVRVRKQKQEQK